MQYFSWNPGIQTFQLRPHESIFVNTHIRKKKNISTKAWFTRAEQMQTQEMHF